MSPIDHIKRGWASLQQLTCKEAIYLVLSITALLTGGMAQIFLMNEWEGLFCNGGSSWLATFTMCASAVAAFYVPFFGLWCLWKRPNVRFLLSRRAIGLAVIIGFCDATDGILIFRGAKEVPEMIQAVLTATSVFWTFLAMKLVARDDRNYLSPLVIFSFLCTAGGTIVASIAQFGSGTTTTNMKIWSGIYELGMVLVSGYTVFAYMFLSGFSPKVGPTDSSKRRLKSGASNRSFSTNSAPYKLTEDESLLNNGNSSSVPALPYNSGGAEDAAQVEEEEEHKALGGGKARAVIKVDLGDHLSDFEKSVTIKLGMMAMSLFCQLVWLFLLIPVDAIPWFGDAGSVQEAFHKIHLGWKATFVDSECHNNNGTYGFFFCAFAIFQYAGVLYLNTYSAPLTSMIQQLVSPVSAIVLLIIPAWNVSPGPIIVWQTVIAIFLLIFGTLLYSAWEESTKPKELVAVNETVDEDENPVVVRRQV